MKTLLFTLRLAAAAWCVGAIVQPADAATRSNLFGRNSRSMMGMGDSAAGEFYTVTPGVRSLRAHLRSVGSVAYSGNGRRFSMSFSRNNPRSMRGVNGRMTFTNLRGGGMSVLMRTLRGARVGRPLTILPGAAAVAERAAAPTGTSFRFTGFDSFGFTREQLLNDVPFFGQALAKLIDSGFGSVNLVLQRVLTEFIQKQDPGTFSGLGADFIANVVTDAAGGIISGYPDPAVSQQVLTSAFDLVAFFDPLLRDIDLNGDTVVDFRDERLRVAVMKIIAANADKIIELLNDLGLLSQLQNIVDSRNAAPFTPVDPAIPGTIKFTESVSAVLENAGTTYVYVTREDGSAGEATATITLDPSTTPDPAAFRFATQTVKWADGEAGPRAVALRVIDDRVEDGDVTLSLNLASTSGASMGSTTSAQITIVDNDSATGDSAIAVARNALLVLEYSWSRDKRDLDTFTTFEPGYTNASVGYTPDSSAVYAPYMGWSGDDTTGGGKEVVIVDLDSAISDGLLSPYSIECRADWFDYQDSFGNHIGSTGPARLTVYFKDKVTGKTSPKAASDIFPDTYLPATSANGAQTHVADVDITYDAVAGSVEFTVTPFTPSP